MADENPERNDPVLVRPYITTEPGTGRAGDDDRLAETWPEQAALPQDGTRELPPVTDPAPAQPAAAATSEVLLRQRLLVLGGVASLALLGGAGFLLFGPADDEQPPVSARPTAAVPGVTGSLGAAPAASAAGPSAAPTSRGTSRAAASRATTTAPAAGAPATPNTPSASGAPSPTLAPPPGQARTGQITAASGRCLNLGGLFGIDGSPVQTTDCTGVGYQQFTLATDGTLRVADRCAQVSDDGTVRTVGCDDRPAAQWRAGPAGSLVNPATGHCLTDPGTAGATTTATTCTAAADQRWTLP